MPVGGLSFCRHLAETQEGCCLLSNKVFVEPVGQTNLHNLVSAFNSFSHHAISCVSRKPLPESRSLSPQISFEMENDARPPVS